MTAEPKILLSIGLEAPTKDEVFATWNDEALANKLLGIDWSQSSASYFQGLYFAADDLTPNAFSFFLIRSLEALANDSRPAVESAFLGNIIERPSSEENPELLLGPLLGDAGGSMVDFLDLLLSAEGPMDESRHANFDDDLRGIREVFVKQA